MTGDLEVKREVQGDDEYYNFVVVIPVADRPRHLESCLDSLLELCRRFNYGGFDDGGYRKISVVIADDSKEPANIESHQTIADKFNRRGLRSHYFGQSEQLEQTSRLKKSLQSAADRIIGNTDPAAYYHKGASMMRNITYLKLREWDGGSDDTLFYFIDSDQEFKVKVETAEGDRDLYAVNYFHSLNRIFRDTGAGILTGKVVGDPPVSPSVMTANFLEDVTAFLEQMSVIDISAPCSFHQKNLPAADDAAYHDMADLFGFKQVATSFRYRCTLSGKHDHLDCFNHFASKLNRFFDGEHPTRKSYYSDGDLLASIQSARTIYTGNYIFKPEYLDYFIPFAALKLRMAGPVLGRIIKAEVGDRFVSANLPMLHKRTVREQGVSEFRPGIYRSLERVDLSGEFERQFFGDVMLFSMEQLTAAGFPKKMPTCDEIKKIVTTVEGDIYQKYLIKQEQIGLKLQQLKTRLDDNSGWWNHHPELSESKEAFSHFIDNIENNFSTTSKGYRLIAPGAHKEERLTTICRSILLYNDDREAWRRALKREDREPEQKQ
ncbi:MAG: hypothetical protein ROD09_02680 [Candidatus Sedimenticola sp. (ex Thyasira tokunagai)]